MTLASDPNDYSVISDYSIDFGYWMPGEGMIGDVVWLDLNQNGVQDAGELGINGVTVLLKDYVGDPATDSNGTSAEVVLATNSSIDLTVDFDYYPTPAGTIGDLVWKDLNGNGIQEVGEPGIGSVTVILYGPDGALLATVATDPYGFYRFTGLSAGTYTVAVDNNQSALTGYVPTVTGADSESSDSNINPAVVVLPLYSSSEITIDFGYKAVTFFGTFTQGGWGAVPNGNNPGALLAAKFSTVYPTGVTIGGMYTLTFTSASAIEKFLPQGGTAAKLTSSAVNPTKKINVLAGQPGAGALQSGARWHDQRPASGSDHQRLERHCDGHQRELRQRHDQRGLSAVMSSAPPGGAEPDHP